MSDFKNKIKQFFSYFLLLLICLFVLYGLSKAFIGQIVYEGIICQEDSKSCYFLERKYSDEHNTILNEIPDTIIDGYMCGLMSKNDYKIKCYLRDKNNKEIAYIGKFDSMRTTESIYGPILKKLKSGNYVALTLYEHNVKMISVYLFSFVVLMIIICTIAFSISKIFSCFWNTQKITEKIVTIISTIICLFAISALIIPLFTSETARIQAISIFITGIALYTVSLIFSSINRDKTLKQQSNLINDNKQDNDFN